MQQKIKCKQLIFYRPPGGFDCSLEFLLLSEKGLCGKSELKKILINLVQAAQYAAEVIKKFTFEPREINRLGISSLF